MILRWIALAGVGIALLGGGLLCAVRRDMRARPGEEIVYDDFGFSVRAAHKSGALGSGSARLQATGVFEIVELQVANHAKRVSYRTDQHTPVLVDAQGREYRVASQACALVADEQGVDLRPVDLAPGANSVTPLVFDVPADARGLYLRISWGPGWLDAIDWAVCGDRRLAIE